MIKRTIQMKQYLTIWDISTIAALSNIWMLITQVIKMLNCSDNFFRQDKTRRKHDWMELHFIRQCRIYQRISLYHTIVKYNVNYNTIKQNICMMQYTKIQFKIVELNIQNQIKRICRILHEFLLKLHTTSAICEEERRLSHRFV